MGKASLLTPVYFFSSIRAGSGKSSMLANLAVFLNNINQKIAIVDLDAETPLKLKNSFPRSINLQEYSDISLISQNQDSRYQKNFYFTETSLISYFPAHRLKDAPLLFSDTTLRDFFIQITACFDTVMVNFPPGTTHCQKASELLARTHLWRGKSPVSIIVSQADEKSLVSLDSLIHENPAFYYQLQENTLLLFNRVPTSVEDQKLAENTLNSLELRSLFNFPATHVVGISEEFSYQRQTAAPQVLNKDSIIHQTISSLHRLLTSTAKNLNRSMYEQSSDYQACLDGQLLEKLSPYLEKIQALAAQKLFQHPSDVQVFLEENEGTYRIRIRLTGVKQPLSGIPRTIEINPRRQIKERLSPAIWQFRRNFDLPARAAILQKPERTTLSVKPIYRFDDRFAGSIDFKLKCEFDFRPDRNRYPSPIYFKANLEMPEIPSLSEVLGYSRKQFKRCTFVVCANLYTMPGVTHFFIPPEFDLATTYHCAFQQIYTSELKIAGRQVLQHAKEFTPAYHLSERAFQQIPALPDSFARNKQLEPEKDFLARVQTRIAGDFIKSHCSPVRVRHTAPLLACGEYLERASELPAVSRFSIPPIISINASAKIYLPAARPKTNDTASREWLDKFSFKRVAEKLFPFRETGHYILKLLSSCQEAPSTGLFRFSFSNEQETYKSGMFAKTLPDSPATFSTALAAPASEAYIAFPELNLPQSFKYADVMIDHSFAPVIYRLEHKNQISENRNSRIYNFGHPTFFKQHYIGRSNEKTVNGFLLQRPEVFHRFAAEGFDYHNLSYRSLREKPALSHQILQAVHSPEQIRSYRDIKNSQTMRTDQILDANRMARSLLLHMGRMLEIRSLISRLPSISQLPVEKPVYPAVSVHLTKYVYRHLSGKKPQGKFSAAVSPHLIQILKNFSSSDRMQTMADYNFDTHISQAKPVFCISDPELYTMPVRSGSRQIYHSVSNSLDDRIDIETMIETTKFEHQSIYAEKFPVPDFFCKVPEAVACPLRARKIELPQSLAFKEYLRIKEVLDHESNVCFIADKRYAANFDMCLHPVKTGYRQPVMAKQSLPKAAAKTWKQLKLSRKQFWAVFPDNIETLYRHLLWTFAAKRQQPPDFSASFLAKIDGAARSFRTGDIDAIHHNTFCDKEILASRKLSQNFLRSSIKVRKLSLKDIMNMARQTGEKFSQVNNQLRA